MRDETSSGRPGGPEHSGPRWWRTRRGPLALAALAVMAAAGVPALAAHDARASAPTAGEAPGAHEVATCEGEPFGLTAAEYESLKLHNEARAGAGLGHLCVNPTLTEAARAHAKDMIERKYFSHDNPDGEDPLARIEEAGYADWSSWGENIGWGSGEQADAREVFADLMNSPGHRENILKDGFLEVGIGAVAGEYDGHPDAGMYAMDFGSRDGQEHELPEPAPAAEAPPEEPAPEPAPEGTTPEPAPESTSPEGATPEETTAPQPPAPEEAPPETTTPESTSPEGTVPESTSPEGTTPEETTPEETTPEGTTPEGTPPADELPDEGEVTPPDQEEPYQETPEPGESDEEEQREVAGAQQAICETFGEIREREIAEHRAKAEGASGEDEGEEAEGGEAGGGVPDGGDLASQIIAETHRKIADQFEKSFLNPSFCGSGGEPEAGEGETPEGTTEETPGAEGDRTGMGIQKEIQRQVEKQSDQNDSASDPEPDGGEGTQPGGETTPEGTVPEETTPEETTPEGTAPEETTPEGTSGGGPAGG